ncbi:MAG: methyltransferase domain-containing protein [Chloroflexi bacterium]|nr:methyltransferase domain-containing protein [Chloroflexota bacterium]
MVTGHRFSEQETEEYYDAEDVIYRSVWDADGSVHWGVFDSEPAGDDNIRHEFRSAGIRLNELMVEYSGIGADSRVLDVGCGNGTNVVWVHRNTGAHATGIDLSGVRIANAVASLENMPDLAGKVAFEKASATELPYAEGTFTHVWSQATVYHVPDKVKVLEEAFRVLEPGGQFIFDDLIKPRTNISESARKFVYDRLLFDTDFSFYSYMDALVNVGFRVLQARDLSSHLARSYTYLSRLASIAEGPEGYQDRFDYLTDAYMKTVDAINNSELGWAQYLCVKPA